MIDPRPVRLGRLRRIAFACTLAGLALAVPIVVTWLFGGEPPSESPAGLPVLSAAAFAAGSILFLASGQVAGAVVALPAIAIGALLDDPATMAVVLLVAAPVAEVAGSVAAFGYPGRARSAWLAAFGEIRAVTARSAARGPAPLRPSAGRSWVLDRAAVATAVASVATIALWGVLVVASGVEDDPTTRTVIASATEFPLVLGAGLILAVTSAILCVLTGRVPGALMALPVLPAVWLDAPVRSEVVVLVLSAAVGVTAVLVSPVPEE